jgi:cytochrome c-type biogenesis protein CcmE
MKPAYIIAVLVISIASGFTMWAFSSSMTPYVDIKTALQSATVVQVRGKILHDSPDEPKPYYDSQMKALRFWVEDAHHQRLEVVYRGAKPDAFDTAPETAATGTVRHFADGTAYFDSDALVVKCPSKYEDKSRPYKPSQAGGTA